MRNTVKSNNNEEKNIEKLTEQKNSLTNKLDELKKKIDDKQQRIKRLNEKKDNLDKEDQEIQRFYDRLQEKRNKNLFNQPQNKDQNNNIEIGEDEDEKEFDAKLEDKIEFNLEQYLTELEASIKKDLKEQNRIQSGEAENKGDTTEYQKSHTNAICIKNTVQSGFKKIPSSDEKTGVYYNTFKISKKTKVKELKQYALKFWGIIGKSSKEEVDQFELVDLEKNPLPIANEDVEVDAVLQKLTDYKVSTLQLRRKTYQEDKKTIDSESKKSDSEIKNVKEGDNADSKKKQAIKDKEQLQDQLKNKKNDVMRAFDKFFANLPLLRSYFAFKDSDIAQKTDKDSAKIGLNVDDYSCIAVVLVVLLYSLTLSTMQSNENLKVSFVHSQKLSYYADIDNNQSDKSFINVSSFEDLENFLIKSQFSILLFDTESEIRKNYSVLGALRIRQVRTREKPCRVQNSKIKCYYTKYNEGTKQKDNINYGKQEYQIYQNAHQSGSLRKIKGKFDTYDSSGYIYDINQELEYNDYVVQMSELFSNNVLNDSSIRAIFIQFTFMNNEDGTYIFFELVLENTPFGVFTQYKSSIYKEQSQALTCTKDPTLYINILFTLFFAYQFFQQGFTYIFSLIGMLNLIFQVFIYLSITESCNLKNYSLGFSPKVDQFIDIGLKTESYLKMVMFASISCGCGIIRLAFFLEFFSSFRKIMQSINHGLLSLYVSVVFLVVIFSSFALVFMNQWGQWIPLANTFLKAFFSLLLMMIGCFDYSQIEYDITALIFFVFVIFIFAFFFLNILTIIYIDEYRQIVLLYGDDSHARYKLRDNIRWFLVFLPEKLQRHILSQ